ncbi:hypothetical protein GCM10020358_36400 [Amorphoplanes nipponensis]|nr:AbfB domain-containing protein [Actinoplanes nipponensis]
MSPEDGQPAGSRPDGWVPPPQYFAPPLPPPPPPPAAATVLLPVVEAPTPHRAAASGRLRTVLVAAAVVSALVAVGLAVASGGDERPDPLFVALPPVPTLPVLPGEVPATASPTRRTTAPPTTQVRDEVPTGGATTVRPAPVTSVPPAVVLPVAGQDLGLEPVGRPGRRLRHRNFLARVDAVGPASPALDRADSRFTVRAGRAGGDCLSFESVNYPGYFLRARDAVLRLDRADGGPGYDAEATFCAVPTVSGGFVLRSRAAPDRYVTESDAVLSLTRVAAAQAVAFVVRPPL